MKAWGLVLAAGMMLAGIGAAQANAWVYCANGKIEVDTRNPEQMRIARGSGMCQMGPQFNFMSDAQTFAQRNFGGPGRSCSCR